MISGGSGVRSREDEVVFPPFPRTDVEEPLVEGANLLVEVMVHSFRELHVLALRGRTDLATFYAVVHHTSSRSMQLSKEYISIVRLPHGGTKDQSKARVVFTLSDSSIRAGKHGSNFHPPLAATFLNSSSRTP